MLRFYFVIVISLPAIIYYVTKASYYIRHPEKYDDEKCFKLAKRFIDVVRKNALITTDVYGMEYLPKEGGFVMYSNHQGKYDALGILRAQDKPCSVVMDHKRAKMPITNEFIGLVRGKRLNREDPKQQVKIIQEIIHELKQGKRFLLFPEGGYNDNHNHLLDFHAGSFKCVQKAECPIVPVAIWDSYKPFGTGGLKRVKTQVHFLEAIWPMEFKGMTTAQISEMVKCKIEERMTQIAEGKGQYHSTKDKMEFAK